jgi:hypothetical protein
MSVPYDPEHITYFAETDYRNQRTRFGIKSRDRTRHMYVIGKSGVGKSTLLENMAIQDIENGEGVAVLDPHGSFADKMLDYIPAHRIKDVVYFAPFDTNYPISFNVLEDVGPDKRHLVVSGLMSTFKKIWVDAWSARMEYILSNTLLALLEYPGATLLGVNRMLSDKDFRKKVVDNITDTSVKAFWTEEFAKYTERMAAEAVPAIQNKIGQLTANPLIRNIIGQPKSSFDIREVMDQQKILIINLSKGRIGDTNTSLLGSMIITKIYLAAMSRAEVTPQRLVALPNFYFYVDEFQSFANETFADILAEARKYKLALIIAHQYVAQMEEKVRDAVFGNVGTTISFRVGPLDAELLEKVFAPQFTANDLVNLGMAQIYLSLLINDIGSPAFSSRTLPPIPRPSISYRNDCIEWSRATYAVERMQVEAETKEWYVKDTPVAEERPEKRVRFADGSEPRPFDRNSFKKPYTQHTGEFRPQQQERPQKSELPKEHKPFAAIKELIKEPVAPKEPEPQIEEQHSPGLSAVLSALSFEKDAAPKPEVVEVKAPDAPFAGEKPLREAVQPVKFSERGPSEKNRDLLKSVLKQALQSQPTAPKTPPQAPVVPQQKPEPSISGEVSHQTIKKVLE